MPELVAAPLPSPRWILHLQEPPASAQPHICNICPLHHSSLWHARFPQENTEVKGIKKKKYAQSKSANPLTKRLTLVKRREGSPRSDHRQSSRLRRLQTALQTHTVTARQQGLHPGATGAEQGRGRCRLQYPKESERNHGTTEWFELEGNLKPISSHPPAITQP